MKLSQLIRAARVQVALVAALVALTVAPHRAAAETPASVNIAAASDLRFALEEVEKAFERDTGKQVTLTFGSSGNFFRQISEGAPFQMFMSADEDYVNQLAAKGKTVDAGALYAIGRIVIFAPKGSPLKVDDHVKGLKSGLAKGTVTKFAIANPEHAPYGRAAEEALRHQNLWDKVQPKLVLGENVSQAAQYATSGATQGGIFAYSLALSPAVSSLGEYKLIPAEWHKPLRQRMVLINGAGETAQAFYTYIQQPPARAVFRRYGFALPGEAN